MKSSPAEEVIALYHERWELELGYDELKTELLDRDETIRRKTRKGVEPPAEARLYPRAVKTSNDDRKSPRVEAHKK